MSEPLVQAGSGVDTAGCMPRGLGGRDKKERAAPGLNLYGFKRPPLT